MQTYPDTDTESQCDKKATIMCRMPDEDTAIRITYNKVGQYSSLAEIQSDASGFIVAPFKAGKECPIYLYEDIEASRFRPELTSDTDNATDGAPAFSDDRRKYACAFTTVKQALESGFCHKTVLARSICADPHPVDMKQLFAKACREYPHCFVALFHTPQKGLWLTATPELLYSQQNDTASTKALAGTMPWSEHEQGRPWSTKNQNEQQMVADYIAQALRQEGIGFSISTPRTIKAGHLAHLCSDINIGRPGHPQPCALRMLDILHPTPATAGVPLDNALQTIERSEGENFREYYAGFCGFLNHADMGTRCYVSLRLLNQATDNRLRLFAGGGILMESQEDSEWQETELKLQTIKKLL